MILWNYYHYYIKSLLWYRLVQQPEWINRSARSAANVITRLRVSDRGRFTKRVANLFKYALTNLRKSVPSSACDTVRKQSGYSLWLYAVRSALVQTPVPDTIGKQVDLALWPRQIDSKGFLHFVNNERPEFDRLKKEKVKPDVIILCTGYKQTFPFLDPTKGQAGQHYPVPSRADVRGIWKRDEPKVGFIGFIRPSFGAIPPLTRCKLSYGSATSSHPKRYREL